jgi:hypothetical protein
MRNNILGTAQTPISTGELLFREQVIGDLPQGWTFLDEIDLSAGSHWIALEPEPSYVPSAVPA